MQLNDQTEAAINAARELLPSGMRSMPTYRKVNPTQSPIMVLALTSDVLGRGELYDLAESIVGQKLLQIQGVGDVQIGGASLPAVRVELEPRGTAAGQRCRAGYAHSARLRA